MKITVIDSGLGGTIFAQSIRQKYPNIEVELIRDHDGFPYGNKELSWLKDRLIMLVEQAKSDIVLIACNTLSCIIHIYNLTFNKRVVDVVTPTTYFFNSKEYKKLCILATKNTIKMQVYDMLVESDIFYIDASILISDLENKESYHHSLSEIIEKIPYDCDAVLLGCTHLIYVKNELRGLIEQEIISQDELISFFKEK